MIFDKKWRLKHQIKRAEGRYEFTDKGLYQTHYYIDKYINEKNIPLIEDYEKTLNKLADEAVTMRIYSIFFPNELDNKEKIHIFAAITFLIMLLHILNEDIEIEVLSWIKPERVDDFILLKKMLKEFFKL